VGTDFFTVEVLTLQGLVTYYVLFFIQLESRRVCLAGITPVWSKKSTGLERRGLQPRLASLAQSHVSVPVVVPFAFHRG